MIVTKIYAASHRAPYERNHAELIAPVSLWYDPQGSNLHRLSVMLSRSESRERLPSEVTPS